MLEKLLIEGGDQSRHTRMLLWLLKYFLHEHKHCTCRWQKYAETPINIGKKLSVNLSGSEAFERIVFGENVTLRKNICEIQHQNMHDIA